MWSEILYVNTILDVIFLIWAWPDCRCKSIPTLHLAVIHFLQSIECSPIWLRKFISCSNMAAPLWMQSRPIEIKQCSFPFWCGATWLACTEPGFILSYSICTVILLVLLILSFVSYWENNALLCVFALLSLTSEELYLCPELRCW